MASEDLRHSGIKGILTGLFMAIALLATVARVVYDWQRDDDATVQRRMQEGHQAWLASQQQPHISMDPLPAAQKKKRTEFIRRFLQAIRSDEGKAAYAMTSASFQEKTSLEAFGEMIRKHPGIKQDEACEVWVTVSIRAGLMESKFSGPKEGAQTIISMAVEGPETWAVTKFKVETTEEHKAGSKTMPAAAPPPDPKETEAAIRKGTEFVADFLKLIRADNPGTAYLLMTSPVFYRRTHSQETFELLARDPGIKDVEHCHVSATLNHGGGTTNVAVSGPPRDRAKTIVEITAHKVCFGTCMRFV